MSSYVLPLGLCSECLAGEVGQVVGLIKDRDPIRRFDGYTDRAGTILLIVQLDYKQTTEMIVIYN